MTPEENAKMQSFYKWIVSKNPSINTCIEMYKAIDKFIEYKLTTDAALDSVKDKMDAEFAQMMEKNFNAKN